MRLGRFLAQPMHASVHVCVFVVVAVHDALDYRFRLLCCSRVVEIYEFVSIDLFVEYREVGSYFFYVNHGCFFLLVSF